MPLSLLNKSAVAGTSSHCISSFPPDDASLLAASVSHGKAKAKARRSDLFFPGKKDEKVPLAEQNSSSLHGAGGCAMCGPRTPVQFLVVHDASSGAVEEQRLTWTGDLSSLRQSRMQLQVGFNHRFRFRFRFRLVALLRCRKLSDELLTSPSPAWSLS